MASQSTSIESSFRQEFQNIVESLSLALLEDDGSKSEALATMTRIGDLAREPKHRELLGEQLGITQTVGRILSNATLDGSDVDHQLVAQSARVIANIVADTDSNRKIILEKTEAIPDLIRVCREFNDPIIVRNCCGALTNLACDNDACRQAINSHGGIPVIVSAIQQHEGHAQTLAIQSLDNMCSNKEIQSQVFSEDIVNALVNVCKTCDDDDVIKQMMTLFGNSNSESMATLTEQGAVDYAFSLLIPDSRMEDIVKVEALQFLTKSFNFTSVRKNVSGEQIAVLTSTFTNSTIPLAIRQSAFDALIQFSSDQSVLPILLEMPHEQFMGRLMSCIQADEIRLKFRAIMMLSNICVSERFCIILLEVPGLYELLYAVVNGKLDGLSHIELQLLDTSISILRTLCLPQRNKLTLVSQKEVLSLFFRILSHRSDFMVEEADQKFASHIVLQVVVALRHLATNCPENIRKICNFADFSIEKLYGLQEPPNDAVKFEVCRAMSIFLSCKEVQPDIIRVGGLSSVGDLMSSKHTILHQEGITSLEALVRFQFDAVSASVEIRDALLVLIKNSHAEAATRLKASEILCQILENAELCELLEFDQKLSDVVEELRAQDEDEDNAKLVKDIEDILVSFKMRIAKRYSQQMCEQS